MTDCQIAWVAGVIEGEGSFAIRRKGEWAYPGIWVSSTDLDVLEKLKVYTGRGHVRPHKYTKGLGKKPIWVWNVSDLSGFHFVADLIRPWLCERRLSQLEAVEREIVYAGRYYNKLHRKATTVAIA